MERDERGDTAGPSVSASSARTSKTQQMLVNYLLALLLVYIVMASQFESLAHPFAILVSIPFALWGAAWFLWITDSPFNLMGQIGVLIFMGIVVKNGIVLIDHINNLRRKGYSREEAIELGGRERRRPILMTAATAVLALVPMAIGRTELDGLYYYPLARTIIGGLTASTFFDARHPAVYLCPLRQPGRVGEDGVEGEFAGRNRKDCRD